MQVAIDSCVTVALNPFGVVVTGSGRSPAVSGVRTTHAVAEGSLTKPGGTRAGFSSVTVTSEVVRVAYVHWNVANPLASVVTVAVEPAPVAGSTQSVGMGLTVVVMSQSGAGTRSFVPGSGVRSTSLRTVSDGAHRPKAASRSASSRSSKSATRYTSSVVMSNVPTPENTSSPDTALIRSSDDWLLSPAPTAIARMCEPCAFTAFAFGTAASFARLLSYSS